MAINHVDYWRGRLCRRTYPDRNGGRVESAEWYLRLKEGGSPAWFNLQTGNAAAAAHRAKEIGMFAKVHGLKAAVAKFKAGGESIPKNELTVGQYLQAVQSTSLLCQRTFLNYRHCFHTIISEAFGVQSGPGKYDYKTGGNQAWLERIDKTRLQRVTPQRVTQWQRRRVANAGHSPVAIASARRTCNSYVRCARSLFSKEVLKHLKGVQLPSPLPFDGVELFESGSMKYVSRVNVRALIAAAKGELKPNDPEAYKVFLLGLFAGMRRAEIDLAEWRMIDWGGKVLKLQETEWLHLKTEDSAGQIAIDPEVLEELRQMMPQGKGPFIVSSRRRARNDSALPYYRCDPVFDRLNAWLRSKGVTANKPLHELRKEIGALIATQHGIYAASRFLRHSDITTTARHYAEHKARITVGLGKLLDTEIKPIAQEARP